MVRGIRDETGPPLREVQWDREHRSPEHLARRTVGLDRIRLARGFGVPRSGGRWPRAQDPPPGNSGEGGLAPVRALPRRRANLTQPSAVDGPRVGLSRLQ